MHERGSVAPLAYRKDTTAYETGDRLERVSGLGSSEYFTILATVLRDFAAERENHLGTFAVEFGHPP